eukprot:CAMPEP_0172499940 /NCGR_PEP_ID=MMETSP1066-20121228/132671_1 /TAXON_ID=671091 /ORGANISM="Coscinodiscus wailesii, Strain CCMP2513" /LENGTH=293 /DNA_ID=CAMNT_0013273941 /DNA_START=53 /DNA_END=933 /DNA_ORIENTATION=+
MAHLYDVVLLFLLCMITSSTDSFQFPPSEEKELSVVHSRKRNQNFGGIMTGEGRLNECNPPAINFSALKGRRIDKVWRFKDFVFGEKIKGSNLMTVQGADGKQYEIETGYGGVDAGDGDIELESGGRRNNLLLKDGLLYGLTRDGSKGGGVISILFPSGETEFAIVVNYQGVNDDVSLSTYFYDAKGDLIDIMHSYTSDFSRGENTLRWIISEDAYSQGKQIKAIVLSTYNSATGRFDGIGISKIYRCAGLKTIFSNEKTQDEPSKKNDQKPGEKAKNDDDEKPNGRKQTTSK